MRFFTVALALAGLTIAGPLAADEALQKKHMCFACHQMDKKGVGPAYRDIAKKYKGQDVAAQLQQKVKKGGAGTWGQVPLPPNTAVPDADVKKLVDWILQQG
jgi:cytochrome c